MSSQKSAHQFSLAPQVNVQRSVFDRSHTLKTTFNSANLVPIFFDEVLPGDTMSLQMNSLCRIATPIFPIMDNIYMDTFFFFVPNRLVWEHWENFCGSQPSTTGDTTDYLIPQCVSPEAGYTIGSLQDYFGIPCVGSTVGATHYITHNNLLMRGYNLIWNEWFRDQNLQNAVTVDMADGPDTASNYTLLSRGKRHDYFTSCLPWPQKNNTGTPVSVGLTGNAPVIGIGWDQTSGSGATFSPPAHAVMESTGSTATYSYAGAFSAMGYMYAKGSAASGASVVPEIFADLNAVTGITIDALRLAFQTQKLYERDARGGTRYIEVIKSHFGVTNPDFRLQRPEYLGGGTSRLNINAVAQTGATGASGTTTPQGNLSAFGVLAVKNNGFTQSFTEHGHIIGLCEVRSDMTYGQGLNRMYLRQSRLDFYWPVFQAIGEQVVTNQEIYMIGNTSSSPGVSSQDAAAFGYQEAWADYRYKPSLLTGLMRTDAASSLSSWHLGFDFASLPTLGSTFITDAPPIARVVAVESQPQFIGDFFFSYKCARPMPVWSVPGNIDRF